MGMSTLSIHNILFGRGGWYPLSCAFLFLSYERDRCFTHRGRRPLSHTGPSSSLLPAPQAQILCSPSCAPRSESGSSGGLFACRGAGGGGRTPWALVPPRLGNSRPWLTAMEATSVSEASIESDCIYWSLLRPCIPCAICGNCAI